jgi:hypothetical protein
MAFRARVANHRLILDEPTDLPEGSVLDLVLDDEGDDLDDEERERLHDAIEESEAQIKAGQVFPADEVLAALRPKR